MTGRKLNWTIHHFNENVTLLENQREVGHISSLGFLSNKATAELGSNKYIFKYVDFPQSRLQVLNITEERQLAEVRFNLLSSKADLTYNNEVYTYSNPSFSSAASWKKGDQILIEYSNKYNSGELSSFMDQNELESILIMAGIQTRKQFIGWIVVIILFIWLFFFF